MRSQRTTTWGLVALLLVLGAGPAMSDDPAGPAAAADPVAAAEAALEPLRRDYMSEETARAKEMFPLHRRKLPAAELLKEIRELLEPLDAIGREIAPKEIELARALTEADRPVEACRALSRAVGHDASRIDAIQADAAFAPLRSHMDYEVLLLRATIGRGHLDTGDPLEFAFHTREHDMRLRLPHGDPTLRKATPVVARFRAIMRSLVDAPAPERLTFANYDQLVRLGMILPHTHYGWPYRHAALFDASRAVAEIREKAKARFEERKDERDGPYWAFLSFFPAAHTGHFDHVKAVLAYLDERAPYLFHRALDGLIWVLDQYVGHGDAVPGTSLAQSRKLLEQVKQQGADTRLRSDRLLAWTGWAKSMYCLGAFHLYGRNGLEKDPERGVVWLRGAAELDLAWAVSMLAECYLWGAGVEQDQERAVELARSVCKRDPRAMHALAHCHHYGRGIERDCEKARELYVKAAAKDYKSSIEALGVLLHRGMGGDRDFDGARRWYEKGLELGHARCGRRLGNLAIDTRTSPNDLTQASARLTVAMEKDPDDQLSMIYAWAALQLRGKVKEARALAKTWGARLEGKSAKKDLAVAMGSSSCLTSKAMRNAKKIDDEEERTTLIGCIHYVNGMRDLVKGKKSSAKRAFKRCIKSGFEDDSTRFSSQMELERLEKSSS